MSDSLPLPKKDEKKQQVYLKLEWIFGIRKNIFPNVFVLDKDTVVYPASNYVVICNHTKNMGPVNAQHYIPGSPESKGISKIATCTLAKKVIAFSEEFEDKIFFQFYNTTIRQGYKNFPSKISSYCFNTAPFLHCECLSFSHRKKTSNFLVALLSSSSSSAAAAHPS